MDVPSGERHELCRGTHAEQNAIIQAAKHGIAINGATLFCTHQPCFICTKMIINAGIRNVFYQHPYGDPMAEAMLKQSNINLYLWRVQNGYDL
jgi:dCMP deaminase